MTPEDPKRIHPLAYEKPGWIRNHRGWWVVTAALLVGTIGTIAATYRIWWGIIGLLK